MNNRSPNAAAVLRDTVEQRLDTINVLAEALAAAVRDGAGEKVLELRMSLARFVSAFRWNADACVDGLLAYAHARDDGDEDLFAPAFVLAALAPEGADTARLMARLPEDTRALIGRLGKGC